MRSVGKPLLDHQGEMPLPVVNSLFDALYPPGLQWYWRADFVKELSDEAIERHVRHGSALPTMHSTVHLYAIDGAAHRVGKTDTAFSYRDANWAEVIVGVDPDPANSTKIAKWCKEYFDALHPYSAGGAYVNFMMEEGQERVQASFRDNYDRLARIKSKYDPANMPAHTAWVRDYWAALHPLSAGGAYVNFMMDEGQDRIKTTYRDNYPRLTDLKRQYDPSNVFHMNQNIQ
jgi:FAD/FMN-containing dehydrogenase